MRNNNTKEHDNYNITKEFANKQWRAFFFFFDKGILSLLLKMLNLVMA